MEKTKDCPFCGSDKIYVGHRECLVFHVQCRQCFASSGGVTYPDYDEEARGIEYWDNRCKEIAIEKWNKRNDE